MKHLEEELQYTVARYLDIALPDNSVWFHVPNGGKRNAREAARLKGLGVKPGIPDIYILYDGKSICIELKTLKGRVTPIQKERMDELETAGALVFVCRSLNEVMGTLQGILPMKVRAA